jgi:hypothetical protein
VCACVRAMSTYRTMVCCASLITQNRADIDRLYDIDQHVLGGIATESSGSKHVSLQRPTTSMVGLPLVVVANQRVVAVVGSPQRFLEWEADRNRLVGRRIKECSIGLSWIVVIKVRRVSCHGLERNRCRRALVVHCVVLARCHVVESNRVVGVLKDAASLRHVVCILHQVAQTQHPREAQEGFDILHHTAHNHVSSIQPQYHRSHRTVFVAQRTSSRLASETDTPTDDMPASAPYIGVYPMVACAIEPSFGW